MDDKPAIDNLASGEPAIDFGDGNALKGVGPPLARVAKRRPRNGLVAAHERTPEIASQIDVAGKLIWSAEIAAQDVQIEIAVIVEVSGY